MLSKSHLQTTNLHATSGLETIDAVVFYVIQHPLQSRAANWSCRSLHYYYQEERDISSGLFSHPYPKFILRLLSEEYNRLLVKCDFTRPSSSHFPQCLPSLVYMLRVPRLQRITCMSSYICCVGGCNSLYLKDNAIFCPIYPRVWQCKNYNRSVQEKCNEWNIFSTPKKEKEFLAGCLNLS